MKIATRKILITLLFLTLLLPLGAQTPDLRIEKEITPEYIVYLAGKEAEYLIQVSPLLAGDDTPTMKAHMGLAILQAAWTHVNGDTLVNDLEYLFDDVGVNTENIFYQSYEDILPLFFVDNPNDFVLNLTDFFNSGTYPAYRDSVNDWLENIGSDIDEIGSSIDWFGKKTDPLAEMFGEHWNAVAEGTADFEYSVQLAGTKYENTLFIFSREFFNRLDRINLLGENMAETLGNGFARIIDSVNVNSSDIDPGVAVTRSGLDSLYNLLDSVQVLLWNQPFAPFEFDLAGIDSLQEMIVEFDTLLAGKEYPIGPEAENKTIRPRGIIESLADSDGLWGIYQDYYRMGEPTDFTFSNTFPHGITYDMRLMINSDLILNTNDSYEELDTRIHDYQNSLIKDYLAPDEHFGMAMTLVYDLLNDEEYFGNIEDAMRFISEGHIDSLTYYFDWSSFDLQYKIDEIRYHIDQYIESDELSNFVILMKENMDDLGSYEIGPNSEFSITYLTASQVIMMTKSIEMAMEAMSKIADGLTVLYDELSSILILDLDPTMLDFSNAETDLDIILILEQSNPEFLTVTPYGIERFHELGDWFEESFLNLNTFFENMTDLMTAMKPYEADFDINAENMEFIMDMMAVSTWELYEDFAYPDSTHWNGSERVNLSAWFDNPPVSFLQMWKKYITGVDSTLGGMFPDRFKINETYELPVLPKQFKLYPVYPNPFNPVAKIEFDLPQAADVRLSIINLNGETVNELINNHYPAGKIITSWNAGTYPSGIYFCRLSIDGTISIRKMTLMK
ncbi:MAG: T9SS type A sorting domain-containing protein [Candidatus Marinimicrobia bacterium]|nr:T9SS type A sorting domain-containing protein [Candidatus Neomarinimicrobiota bacterium]